MGWNTHDFDTFVSCALRRVRKLLRSIAASAFEFPISRCFIKISQGDGGVALRDLEINSPYARDAYDGSPGRRGIPETAAGI